MHTISSYRVNRPTNKQTNKQTNTQTGAITIHCAAASLARNVTSPSAAACSRADYVSVFVCILCDSLEDVKRHQGVAGLTIGINAGKLFKLQS